MSSTAISNRCGAPYILLLGDGAADEGALAGDGAVGDVGPYMLAEPGEVAVGLRKHTAGWRWCH